MQRAVWENADTFCTMFAERVFVQKDNNIFKLPHIIKSSLSVATFKRYVVVLLGVMKEYLVTVETKRYNNNK